MDLFCLLRIVLMTSGIFAAGLATGRYTAPPPLVPAPATEATVSGGAGRAITPQLIVLYYDQRLKLGPRQRQAVLAEAQEFVREIARTEPRTRERFDIFRKYYPRIRTLLRAEQQAAFDALVKLHEEKMTATMQAKEAEAK